VIVYFCKGLSEREPKEVHMSDLHREKQAYVLKRILYKTGEGDPANLGPPGS
jgi:hypothetical protein